MGMLATIKAARTRTHTQHYFRRSRLLYWVDLWLIGSVEMAPKQTFDVIGGLHSSSSRNGGSGFKERRNL